MSRPIITLLTDFGEYDSYVGAMKGVILSILPDVQLIDISHQMTPQDVRQAAFVLANIYSYYPPYTVHLIVVDPGVGSDRQPIAMKTQHGIFVAPDNGVLSYIRMLEEKRFSILLDNPTYWLPSPSNTFHGRDIFSPVAAHLASGVSIHNMGTPLEDIVTLPELPLEIGETFIKGEVVKVDRFGNLLTNIASLSWIDVQTIEFHPPYFQKEYQQVIQIDSSQARITCGWHRIHGIHRSYSTVGIGHILAVISSGKELEIAVNQGNASEILAMQAGDPVTLYFN